MAKKYGDQTNNDDVGGGGNMTFKTTSKSPKTTGAPAWRPTGANSDADNNGFHEYLGGRQGRERKF